MWSEFKAKSSRDNARTNIVKQSVKKEESNALKKIQLKHVAVGIRGKETEKGSIVKVNALLDSGAEIPVISEELIEGMYLEQVGEVSLQCVVGEAIPAKLVKVDVRLCETPNDTDGETRTNQVKVTITITNVEMGLVMAGRKVGSSHKYVTNM